MTLIIVCIVAVVAMNILATVRLAQATCFSSSQKIIQLLLLWALPIIGFALVWHFLNEVKPRPVNRNRHSRVEDGASIDLRDASTTSHGEGD